MNLIILLILGLCFGSFVNAFVWRLRYKLEAESKAPTVKVGSRPPKDYSILAGRSMCPDCRHQLSVKDLIPVLSWLSLKGRCRYCRKAISWQYPVVEALTAGLFVFSYLTWPYGLGGLGGLRFAVWLTMLIGFMALVVYDLRWMLLPNRIVYPMIGLAVLLVMVRTAFAPEGALTVLSDAAWGLAIGGGIFYILFQVSKGRWIGGGDVKLGFLLGLLLGGPWDSLLMLFGASLLGTMVVMPLLISGKASRDTHIPFGPFLIVAAILVQLLGYVLVDWYKRQIMLGSL